MTKFASMCKLKAGRLAREVSDACLQYWGGMGFTNEVLVSRMYRSVVRHSSGLLGQDAVGQQGHAAKGDCSELVRFGTDEKKNEAVQQCLKCKRLPNRDR